MLLERNDDDPDLADEDGRTPLSFAAEIGHVEVVGILLGQNNVNPNTGDKRSRTPLWWAARYGRTGVVRMLLERNHLNCNGICLLFSLLYLPDVGCFLFRFYNSSVVLFTLYFPYLL